MCSRALRGSFSLVALFRMAWRIGCMQYHGRNSLDGDDVNGVSNLDLRFSLMPGWKEQTI